MVSTYTVAFITCALFVVIAEDTHDKDYLLDLAIEKQHSIRRLRRQINLSKDTQSEAHALLQLKLSKTRHDLDNIRLLQKGLSGTQMLRLTALQHELDEKRAALDRSNNITNEKRREVALLAQQILKLKQEMLLSSHNGIPKSGFSLEHQIQDTFNALEKATTIEKISKLREKIYILRRARVKQLEKYIDHDSKLVQGYRIQLSSGNLDTLHTAVYREKVEAAHNMISSHKHELARFMRNLSSEEIKRNKRLEAHMNRLRDQLLTLEDPRKIAEVNRQIARSKAKILDKIALSEPSDE